MRSFVIIGFILALSVKGFAQVQALEAEGNLESPNPLGCVDIDSISNIHNPVDLYSGFTQCLEVNNYEVAVQLFVLAEAYGRFDILRVKDETAHQALQVIQIHAFSSLSQNQKDSLRVIMEQEYEQGSQNLKNNCTKIREIGPPSYHPTYMIQHGLAAFTENDEDGLVEVFESKVAFEMVLISFLQCEE